MERLAALSVDLDEVACYTAIHGLGEPPATVAHAIYERAVPRFEALFEELELRGTFFAIGEDLRHRGSAERLRGLHRAGHEIGNHSYSHFYDLTRRSEDAIREEVRQGIAAITDAVGTPPEGFRAPGYSMNDALIRVLEVAGVTYDSSVFPCPAYYGAKTAAIAAIALLGRRSHSIVGDPRVLAAPVDPYRVGRPYWRRGRGIVELPIGVTGALTGRLPFIGTSVVLAGPARAAQLARLMVGRPFVNLELHGMDLADRDADGLGFLAAHQPDLRVSLEAKRAALVAVVGELRRAGYRFVTLAQAAAHFGA